MIIIITTVEATTHRAGRQITQPVKHSIDMPRPWGSNYSQYDLSSSILGLAGVSMTVDSTVTLYWIIA